MCGTGGLDYKNTLKRKCEGLVRGVGVGACVIQYIKIYSIELTVETGINKYVNGTK